MLVDELDDNMVFNALEDKPVMRCFPHKNVSHAVSKVLHRVLAERFVPRDLKDVGIKECLQWDGCIRKQEMFQQRISFVSAPLHYTISTSEHILSFIVMLMLMSSLDMPSISSPRKSHSHFPTTGT